MIEIRYQNLSQFPEIEQGSFTPLIEEDGWVFPKQVHGDAIVRIETGQERVVADGLFTTVRGITLAMRHSDCQAILFYDPVQQVVAIAHVGWRGNVANMPGKMVARLKSEMGCKASDIRVAISPSLGPMCAEFVNYRREWPESFWLFQVKPNYFDLRAMSKAQLAAEGVLVEHIECAEVCTLCDRNWFSYRRERGKGHNASAIALKR